MTKEILIGDSVVKMTGNAATALRFRQVFGSDLLRLFSEQGEAMDINNVLELGYIMTLQAAGSDFVGISAADYVSWLEGFETMDMFTAAKDIVGVWIDTNKTASKAKKK